MYPGFISLLVIKGFHINSNTANFTNSYLITEARPSTPCWAPTNHPTTAVVSVRYSALSLSGGTGVLQFLAGTAISHREHGSFRFFCITKSVTDLAYCVWLLLSSAGALSREVPRPQASRCGLPGHLTGWLHTEPSMVGLCLFWPRHLQAF